MVSSSILLNKAYTIVEKLEDKAKRYGYATIIMSALDMIFCLISLFTISLTLVTLCASVTSITAITVCGRIIQVSKINKLRKILKPLNLVALAWFVNKYNKYLKESKMKTEKLSKVQIASIVGACVGVVFAIVSVFVPEICIAGDSIYNILISTGIETVCAFAGTFKGYTKLTEEEIAKIKEKQKQKEEEKKLAQLEQAKQLLETYKEAEELVKSSEQQENNG